MQKNLPSMLHTLYRMTVLFHLRIYLASHAKQIYFINVNNVPGICIKELGNSSYDEIIIYISLSLFYAKLMVTKTINAIISRETNCQFFLLMKESGHYIKRGILIYCQLQYYFFANLQSIENIFSYSFI